MQERDEDLAASYEASARKDKTILKLIIAVILLSAVLAVFIALTVLYNRRKLPFLTP
jgi:flagellar basal body-associated protein FliL